MSYYIVESFKNGDGFVNYEGESFEKAKIEFECAWECLTDYDKKRCEQITFCEYQKTQNEILEEYGCIPDSERTLIAFREGEAVYWYEKNGETE